MVFMPYQDPEPGAVAPPEYWGDDLDVSLIGATLGYRVFSALLLGTLLAGVFAGLLLVRDGSAARKKTFAYGPFLAAGTVVLLLV